MTRRFIILSFLFAVTSCTFLEKDEEEAELQGIEFSPGDDIQAIVDTHPEVTTFILKSGTYRMQEIWPKDGDTFIGEDGAILNGSKILTEFEQDDGLYYAPNQTQEGEIHGGDPAIWCYEGWERCTHSYDLFFDDEPLRHVTSLGDVASGKWFFDYDANRIYFADDPEGHIVETSVSRFAFTDNSNAGNVTIQNLVIEKYANTIQYGVVGVGAYCSGWLVDGCEIKLNHGAGVLAGSNFIIKENYIHHNGQMGIGTGAEGTSNVLFENNEISYNNYAHCSNENGGSKFSVTDGLEVIGNYVHHNIGIGLWTDVDNYNVLYDDNWVWWNDAMGISHEVSHNVIIRNNDVRYNGIAWGGWLWGSQILIQNSNDGEIYNNTVYVHADGGNGISIIHQPRLVPPFGPFYAQNNYFHDNEVTYFYEWPLSGVDDDTNYDENNDGEGDWACMEEANNLFDYNTYHIQSFESTKWSFCIDFLSWDEFKAAGQEPNGTADILVEMPDDTPPKVCSICPGL